MTRLQTKPIVIMAGGTGGHVFPALAVAEYLRSKGEHIVWFGTRLGIESRVVPAANFRVEWISVQGLRGKGLAGLLLAPMRLAIASLQALIALIRLRPKAVLGMGGFVSGPGGLTAWLLRIPLFIHEQNAVIGLTNRLLCHFSRRSFFAFPAAMIGTTGSECVGNPVRADLVNLPLPAQRMTARSTQTMNVLVIGGSLGAASLNRFLPQAIALIDRAERPCIRHQCGKKHLMVCEQYYREAKVDAEVNEFIDDMGEAYAWADLVVCRSGALTIAELAAVGVASVLIPYPYAVDNHQYFNARFLEQQQAACILSESDLNAKSLSTLVTYYQQHRSELVSMAEKARSLATINATERVAQGILEEIQS